MGRSQGPLLARLALAVSTMVALQACNPFVTPYRRDPAVQVHPEGATTAAQWNGTLASPAGAALAGTAVASPGLDGTSTYVYVSLVNAAPGDAYRWQLREGPCGADGAAVGAAAAYGTLTADPQGRAAGSATLRVLLSPARRYHVRASAGPPGAAGLAACGELAPPTR